MELGTDWKFRDDLFNSQEEGSTCPIELIVQPFTGIVYRYTRVTFKVDENDVPKMLYDYDIIKTNDLSMVTLRKSKNFNTVLGLILNNLILDSVEQNNGSAVETGTDDN